MDNRSRKVQLSSTLSQVVFSDVNLDVHRDSNYELVFNEDSIQKSILTILSTRKKTRIFRRDFGSSLEDLLFDPMDDITVGRIKSELVDKIKTWETRIILVSASVKPDTTEQQYYVSLEYQIPKLQNKLGSLNFNLNKR